MLPKCQSCLRAHTPRILVGVLLLADFLTAAGLLLFTHREAEGEAIWHMQALVLLRLFFMWIVGGIAIVTLNRIVRCYTSQ